MPDLSGESCNFPELVRSNLLFTELTEVFIESFLPCDALHRVIEHEQVAYYEKCQLGEHFPVPMQDKGEVDLAAHHNV